MSDFLKGKNFVIVPKVTTTQRNALTATNGMLVYDNTANAFYKYENGAWSTFAGGSGSVWGGITGTLSDQTDLNTALSSKANASDLTAHTSNTSNPHSVTATQVDALKRDGSNANSDIDLGAYKLNAQSFGVKGANGAGHVSLKHQASNATASANETSLFAGSDGELYYKNDGNSVVQIATRAWVTAQGYITNVVTALGYTPENSANKTDTMAGNTASSTKYLSAKGIYDWVISLGYQAALTAANFGSFINGLTSKTTPVDADYIPVMDSADSNATKKLSWANFKATLKTYFDTLYPAKHILIGVTQTTVQGTATETIVETITIPADWFATSDGLNISSFATKSAQTASDTWIVKIYLNSAANLTGAAEILRTGNLANTIRWNGVERNAIVVRSATTLQVITVTSGSVTDVASSATLLSQTVTIPNIANQMYLLVTLQHTGSSQADTLTHIKTILNKERA